MASRELRVVITGDASSLNRAFGSASAGAQGFGAKMQKVGGQLTSAGKKLTLGVTTPLVAAGVASFKMANDFETSMSRVIGLAGQSEEQVGKWSKQLITLGPKLGKGPRELADALYFVASSGVPAGKALSVVTAAAKASSAGLGDTAQVADAVTSVMNAYGAANISAAQATDILVATVREGKGEASEFAPVIGNVTAFASKLGVSFDEVGAALAAMTQLGTDAATASTQLSAVFSQLVKETPKGAKALKEVGLSYQGLRDELKTKGLIATLGTLDKAFGGNVTAMSAVFGNIRALRGVFGLLDADGTRVQDIFKRMGESSGALAHAFEVSQKRTGFTMEKFRASVEAAGIAIGSILGPIVERIAVFLTRVAIAFGQLSPHMQELIITFAAVAAAVGPVLIIVGSLVGAVGALIPVFAALVTPVGIVVIALVALVAALVAAVLWPDKLAKVLERMGLSHKDAKQAVESLQNAFTAIKAVVQAVMPAILAIVKPALDLIKGALMIVSGILRGDFSQAWQGIKTVISAQLRLIVALMTGFPRIMLGLALQVGEAIIKGIGQGLRALPQKVEQSLNAIGRAIADVAAKAPDWAAGIGRAIIDGIIRGLSGLVSRVASAIEDGVRAAISHAHVPFLNSPQDVIGVSLVDGIIRGWNSKQAGIENAIVDGVNAAIDKAQQAIVDKQSVFASAFDTLASSALAAFDKVSDQFETRTEKKIRTQDERRAAADRQAALASARAGLGTALTGDDPQAIIDAQKAVNDALFAIQRAADEKRAAQERKARDNSRELQRRHFEEQLGTLEAQLEKGRITAQQFRQRVLALFEKFDVPFRNAGRVLGGALNEGLHDSFADAAVAARRLVQTIADEIAKLKVVVNVQVRATGGNAPHRQHGGPVRRGSPYIVGEAGPELFVPTSSGRIATATAGSGASADIHTHVYLDSTQIAEVVRREYLRFEKRNGRSAV